MDSNYKSNKSLSKIDELISDDLPNDLFTGATLTLDSTEIKTNPNPPLNTFNKEDKVEIKDPTNSKVNIEKDSKLNNTSSKTESKPVYKTLYSDHGYIEVNKSDWENEELFLVPFTNKKSNLSGSLHVSKELNIT